MPRYRLRNTRRTPPDDIPKGTIPAWLHPRSRAYLQSRNISEDEAYRYDLGYCPSGEWKDRLIIPMYSASGRLWAFQGRVLDSDYPWADKYRTEGPRPLYHTLRADSAPDRRALCLVEGPFDLFAVNRVIPAAACLGSALSAWQRATLLWLLKRFSFKKLVIWLDREAYAEAFRLQAQLLPFVQATVLIAQESKDPGELPPDRISAHLKEALIEPGPTVA